MQTFGKQEHLCNITEIQKLFNNGHSIFKHPVKLLWLPAKWEGIPSVKVLISVPKRNFKKAVDRNRIKRLLRECYRRNKQIIEQGLENRNCYIALIYAGREISDFKLLEPIIIHLIKRLIKEYETTVG
jgi:ribonuclease P protein component